MAAGGCGKGLAMDETRVGADETKTEATTAAAVAAAEAVDGGGVCRDKYLPVNTERLALPIPLYPYARRKRHA